MDAADLFRQAQSSVNRAREAKSSRARESSHESDDHSPRIAHTLTACCRCRQVCATLITSAASPQELTLIRERRDAILTSRDACPARGPALFVNISIRQKEKRYLERM